MERTVVNPWTWQDEYGFVQGNSITGAEQVLLCAGQTSVDENGAPLHPGDMAAQMIQAIDNLETVLNQAGMDLSNVMRLNFYVTDVDAFFEAAETFGARLGEAGCLATGTLLGVTRLAFPELMCEIEATAVA